MLEQYQTRRRPPSPFLLPPKYAELKWSIRMENYIVRIYRTDGCQPESLIGLVEAVETGEIKSFSTFSELTTILAGSSTIMEETATRKLRFASP